MTEGKPGPGRPSRPPGGPRRVGPPRPYAPRRDGPGGPRREGPGGPPRSYGPRREGGPPARPYAPRGEGPPRPAGDGPPRPFRSGPPRPYTPRRDGPPPRPYAPRGDGPPPRPYAPRRDGPPPRPYAPRADGPPPRPYAPRRDGPPPRPYAPRADGPPPRPYAPRRDAPPPRPYAPRPAGDGPARPFTPRTDGPPPRPYGPRRDGPQRPYIARGAAPPKPYGPRRLPPAKPVKPPEEVVAEELPPEEPTPLPPPPPLPEDVVAVAPEPEPEVVESSEPLAPLPSAALEGDRPILRLRVPGSRRHLNFFRKMVVKPEKFIRAGTIVNVVDRNGELLGCGFYNPKSEIALRMLGPWQEDLIESRLKAAVAFRESLKIPSTAYRVCHGEADGLPGLIVDRYADVHSIQVFSLGMLKHIEEIRALFPKSYVTADERAALLEGFTLPPEKPPESVVVEENGVAFRVDFAKGHKTGFFCDQRDNRKFVAELSRGKTLLDLCCYTGGFSISAAKAGAQRVTAVDMDEDALEVARQNARLNKVKVDFLHADVFNYCRQSREQFDVVVLDPPKLARDREELVKGKRAYYDMNRLAVQRVKPGGIFVTNSCSGLVSEPEFLDILASATADRELRIFKIAGAGADHPWSTLYPEGRYLKVVYAVVV